MTGYIIFLKNMTYLKLLYMALDIPKLVCFLNLEQVSKKFKGVLDIKMLKQL